MTARASDQDLTNFDIFVLALSVLSIVNIALAIAPLNAAVHNVVLIVDGVLSLIFLADFLLRLRRAPHKRTYLIDERGWLDFLGSLPRPAARPSVSDGSRLQHRPSPRTAPDLGNDFRRPRWQRPPGDP